MTTNTDEQPDDRMNNRRNVLIVHGATALAPQMAFAQRWPVAAFAGQRAKAWEAYSERQARVTKSPKNVW